MKFRKVAVIVICFLASILVAVSITGATNQGVFGVGGSALLYSPFLNPPPQIPQRNAEQAHKNIQVLKGMPESKFMNTMFFIRYSLGVSCGYCHVEPQYEKDDKPSKAKAREMMRMVMEMNQKNFEGKPRVNCYTCHRGTTSPANEILSSRRSVQSMLGGRPSFRGEPVPSPSVDEVLNKFTEAIGGKDALAKIKNAALKGNMVTSEGLIVPIEYYYQAPNKSLSVRHFGAGLGDFSDGFDGKTGWTKDNRGLSEKVGERLLQAQMDAEFNDLLRLKDFYISLAVTGGEQMDSEWAYIVSGVSTITGKRERLYFGSRSGLLLRRTITTENIFGAVSSDTYYENYVSVDGVKIAILVSEFTPDFGVIRKLREVDFNTTIDNQKFSKPEK